MSVVSHTRRSPSHKLVVALISAVSIAILWYPLLGIGTEILAFPLDSSGMAAAVGAVAIGGAIPFAAGVWSVDRLIDTVLVFITVVLVFGFAGLVVVASTNISISGSNPYPNAALLGAAYLLTYVLVWQMGVRI